MGGLYCGNLTTHLGIHYITFINEFFPSNYAKVEADLRANSLHGLYSVVRSGLTHEYFIKEISKIEMNNPSGQFLSCGIAYNKTSNPQIVFYVNQYFNDFKGACEQYYDQLKYDTSGSMLQNFEKALQLTYLSFQS